MELQKLRQEKEKKLSELLSSKEEELTRARLELATGKLKDVHKLTSLRREVARLKTILREKEMIKQAGSLTQGEEDG